MMLRSLANELQVVFSPCLFLGLLVCDQDYSKSTAWISIKLGWRISLSPQWTPLTFYADPEKVKIERSGFKLAAIYE